MFIYWHFLTVFFPLPFSPLILPFPTWQLPHVNPFSFLVNSSTIILPPPLAVSLIFMSLSLFCLLVQFVHYIPHMGEIIWYFSFSDWLISLSIMFSRSIHTVTKGKIFSFLWPRSIPLCKCPMVVSSSHLWMDTWATSICWQL